MTAVQVPPAGKTRSSPLTTFVVASRYMPVYIALVLLWVVASIWAPDVLAFPVLRAMAPFAAILAIASLGQMLVIMTGGIDLSTPGTVTLAALIMVGVGNQSDDNIPRAILVAIGVGAVIGLFNGILIGGLRLNALIVTLAVGSLVIGLASRYLATFRVQGTVPTGWSAWTATPRDGGVSRVFWLALALTILASLIFRYTRVGRRFQVAGANPVASHVVGVRVRLYQMSAFVVAGMLYALAGLTLAGMLRTPGLSSGNEYLLGPIAAVVIGGAALTGGLASPVSTFLAAMFLTGLNRTMLVMGLPTSYQNIVFGLVIIGGMLISGDRIIKGVERTLRERRRPKRTNDQEISGTG